MNEKVMDSVMASLENVDNPAWLRSIVDELVEENHRLERELRDLRFYNQLLSTDREYDV